MRLVARWKSWAKELKVHRARSIRSSVNTSSQKSAMCRIRTATAAAIKFATTQRYRTRTHYSRKVQRDRWHRRDCFRVQRTRLKRNSRVPREQSRRGERLQTPCNFEQVHIFQETGLLIEMKLIRSSQDGAYRLLHGEVAVSWRSRDGVLWDAFFSENALVVSYNHDRRRPRARWCDLRRVLGGKANIPLTRASGPPFMATTARRNKRHLINRRTPLDPLIPYYSTRKS